MPDYDKDMHRFLETPYMASMAIDLMEEAAGQKNPKRAAESILKGEHALKLLQKRVEENLTAVGAQVEDKRHHTNTSKWSTTSLIELLTQAVNLSENEEVGDKIRKDYAYRAKDFLADLAGRVESKKLEVLSGQGTARVKEELRKGRIKGSEQAMSA